MTLKQILFFFFLFSLILPLFSQQLFYSTILKGGITGNGGSAGWGSGTINFPIQIPPNSTIKKAYLITARDSLADNITITLNGNNFTFSDASIITNGFNPIITSSFTRPNSSIHVLDITSNIDSSVNNYNLFIPPQPNAYRGGYRPFHLFIIFENTLLPRISCNLFLNTQDVKPITNYNLTNIPAISTNNPVSLGVATTDFCDTTQDGSYVGVNGNTIGLIGGEDLNSSLWTCIGTWANFAHYNDSLFGLDDDTSDSLMAATDALADIKSYVNNGDTTVNVTFTYQSNLGPLSNPIRAVMLSYSTPCDTFTTTATTNIDTVCAGTAIQLQATGGATYSWFSAFSTFNDSTLANPVATPTQTTTYIVTIKNALGCVKTEHVKVWVNAAPKPDTILITPQRCGSADGSITVGNIPNGTAPYTIILTNLQTSNIEPQTSNLPSGNYLLQITDSNGCIWQSDTLFVPEINDITVNFSLYTLPWVFPQPNPLGTAPLTIYTQNSSVNTNLYEWTVREIPASAGMTVTSGMTTPNFNFDSGGTFEICLLAYNNIPACGDTVCKTIVIASPNASVDSLVLVIPNVFSPNHDGTNDNFVLQVQGASLLESLEVEIFNRWGQEVQSLRFDVESSQHSTLTTHYTLWDGTTNVGKEVPEGTYFYVITYTKIPASAGMTGETESLKGTVLLLR